MRDMAGSRATINVAQRYIICSDPQGSSDAEADCSPEKTRRARLQNGPADHGAARPLGPALDVADPVATARAAAAVARAPRGLRRSVTHGASGAIVGTAASGPRRTQARERLWPDR